MEKAILKSIEGGWNGDSSRVVINGAGIGNHYNIHQTVLDPLFWQALVKSHFDMNKTSRTWWKKVWHNFIDHLAEGKDVDSFFNELLK